MKRRTEITIETDRVFVIRRRTVASAVWCQACGHPVDMATPNEAAALAGIRSRSIYRWVEAETIHFTESPDGMVLICLNSLYRSISEVAKHSIT